jgi:MFS family permease
MAPVVMSSALLAPLVDRFGRRRVAVVSDLTCGAFTATIPLLRFAGALPFWALCLLVGLAGFCHTPGDTARSALVPDLAALALMPLSRAAGLYDGAARCASMLGAALGGVLITALGPTSVLLVDAGTFAVSAAAVVAGVRGVVKSHGGAPTHISLRAYRADLATGIRIVLSTPLLAGLCATILVAQGIDQGWSAVLLPDDVRTKLGSALALGLLETLFALFAFAGTLLYSAYGDRFPRRITSITLLITPLGALAAGYAVSAVGLDATLLTAGGLYLVVTIVPATHSAWQRLDAPHPDPGQTPEITPTRAGPNVRG